MERPKGDSKNSTIPGTRERPFNAAAMRDRLAARTGFEPFACVGSAYEIAMRLAGRAARASGISYFSSVEGYLIAVSFSEGVFSAAYENVGTQGLIDAKGQSLAQNAAERLNNPVPRVDRRG